MCPNGLQSPQFGLLKCYNVFRELELQCYCQPLLVLLSLKLSKKHEKLDLETFQKIDWVKQNTKQL